MPDEETPAKPAEETVATVQPGVADGETTIAPTTPENVKTDLEEDVKPLLHPKLNESLTIQQVGAFFYPLCNGQAIKANYRMTPDWIWRGEGAALSGRSIADAFELLKVFDAFCDDEVRDVPRSEWPV